MGNMWFSAKSAFVGAILVEVALALVLSEARLAQAASLDKQGSRQEASAGRAVSKEKGEPGGSSILGPSRLTQKILLDLETKRRAMAQREIEIRKEENRLKELRADIKKRLASLTKIEKRLQKILKKVDSTNGKSMNHLVRAYSAMGPDEAAQLMNTMDINLAVRILRDMQVKKAGSILAVVEPRRAARISEKLARAKIR